MLSLENVRLTLMSRAGPVDILRGVTLSAASGQSLAVVGPSGSGKTSLLMVMAGLERATSGRVTVDGQEFSTASEDELAAIRGRAIGIVFQSFHLMPVMTALENAALPLELAGDPDAFDKARAVLTEVGLEHRLDHLPSQLSGGEQQRVAIARALAPRPKLILADEPTGNLDRVSGRHVIDLLFALQRRRQATLVLITHDERLAQECQRTIRMADGGIVADSEAAAA